MNRIGYWTRRFLGAFAVAAVIIAGAHLLRGRDIGFSLAQGALWGAAASAVFTASGIYRWRRNQKCALCDDIASAEPRAPLRS
jgi:hypothetical protein